ncbi:11682_t:CDS:2 [Paraglomus brasilianum]|uniref:11682_t:CDS:1 n=1 Tax=Paraglomus brasilianum TaxID=144538 RepID=A0A9N8W6K8_9GLOM|nr:11682_t:CDS:2 [Paraglomus brasilianum]
MPKQKTESAFMLYRQLIQLKLQKQYKKIPMQAVSQIASNLWQKIPVAYKWDSDKLINALKLELEALKRDADNSKETACDAESPHQSELSEEIDVLLTWMESNQAIDSPIFWSKMGKVKKFVYVDPSKGSRKSKPKKTHRKLKPPYDPSKVFLLYRRRVQRQLETHHGKVPMPVVSQVASILWGRIPSEYKWNIQELVGLLRLDLDGATVNGNDVELPPDDRQSEEVETLLAWLENNCEQNGLFL